LQVEWDGGVRIEGQIELLDLFLEAIATGGKENKV
jgi:hypothetical protein